MGTAIDIDDGGIFFGGVEISRFHHSVVEVGLAVGCLDGSAFVGGYLVAFPGVPGFEKGERLGAGIRIHEVDDAGDIRFRVVVNEPLAVLAERASVPSALVIERRALSGLHIDGIDVLLDGGSLVAGNDDAAGLGVETKYVHDHPLSAGELLQLFPVFIEQIEMVVAVLLALHDEL